jgi:hypothetical protein
MHKTIESQLVGVLINYLATHEQLVFAVTTRREFLFSQVSVSRPQLLHYVSSSLSGGRSTTAESQNINKR